MKFTRDGSIWLVLFIGGLAGFLGGHFDLLAKAFPGVSTAWEARVELVSALSGFVGAYLRMSPAALSAGNVMASSEHAETLGIAGGVKTPDKDARL